MTTFESLTPALAACAPALARTLEEGGLLEPDLEIPVLWAAFVGRALGGTWSELSDVERTAALDVVEQHLVGGAELLRTAVATGLLEALASEVSGGRVDGPELATHLGPGSRAYLDAWDQLTMGRSTLDPP